LKNWNGEQSQAQLNLHEQTISYCDLLQCYQKNSELKMASKTMEVNCDPHAPPTGFDGLGAGVGAPGVVGGDTVTETVTFANPGVCWMAFVKA